MESNRHGQRALSRRDFLTTSTLDRSRCDGRGIVVAAFARSRSGSKPRERDVQGDKDETTETRDPSGLGNRRRCMSISANYGPPAQTAGSANNPRGIRGGVTFFDTAEVYGPYTNEELVGQALRPSVTRLRSPEVRFCDRRDRRLDSRPERIKRVVEESLKRLKTDRLDLYYQHRVDPTCRSRMSPARSRISSRKAKSFISVSPKRAHERSASTCRAARRRRADRILAVERTLNTMACWRPAKSWESASCRGAPSRKGS